MQDLDIKIEHWKKLLLDLGKRNRLINFKETKRSNVAITSPSYDVLYKKLVQDEIELSFSFPLKTTYDENGEEDNITVQEGDLETNKTLNEQQKTLKVLRGRAKTSIEEQGINSLYLTFGIIRWKESDISNVVISSPLVLVPISLTIKSITDPYMLQIHDDEIVVNPSLVFKFENDFGINLPEFDGHEDDITNYLLKIQEMAKKKEWEVVTDVHLTLLSFLKINMYKDLDNNKGKIVSNPTIKALSGDKSEIALISNELNNFDHDKNIRPIDTYQVVDADSSQQDAILLSKKGISFVLQGPPGTGKSQTITNIIAEAISDGKKVLFVSEKMAALEVVKKRLTEAGLDDFCLTLHSYKANKKTILNQLSKTLNIQKISLREDAIYKLSVLEERRKKLNEYQEQLHQECAPLNISIYKANGRLAKLSATQDIIFGIKNIENTDMNLFNKYRYLLTEFSKTIGKQSEDYSENPWYDCNVPVVTHEFRHDIEVNLNRLSFKLKNLIQTYEYIIEKTGADIAPTIKNISILYELLDFSSESPIFPIKWLSNDLTTQLSHVQEYSKLFFEYNKNYINLLDRYVEDVLKLNANEMLSTFETNMFDVKAYLDYINFPNNKDIFSKANFILSECREIKDFMQILFNQSKAISSILDIEKPNSINSIFETKRLIELILKDPQPVEKWFNCESIQSISELLQTAKNEQIILNDNLKMIRSNYNESILNIHADELLERFNNTYMDVFRIISVFNNSSDSLELTKDALSSFANEQAEKIQAICLPIKNALEVSIGLRDNLHIKSNQTLKGLISLGELLSAVIQNPKPTLAWFDETKEFIIDKIISNLKKTHKEIKQETDEILIKYNKDIMTIDYKNMLIRFNNDLSDFFKYFNYCYEIRNNSEDRLTKKNLFAFVDLQANNLKAYISMFSRAHEASKTLTNILEIKSTNTYEQIVSLNDYLFPIIKAPKPTVAWFDESKDIAIDKIISEIKMVQIVIKEQTNDILLKYKKDILTIDFKSMLFRFNSKYGNFLKYIKGSYRTDKKCLFEFRKDPNNKLTDKEIISLLDIISNIKEKEQWLIDNRSLAIEILGGLYIDDYTDWNVVEKNRIDFQGIKECFDENKIPEQLEKLLIESKVFSLKEEFSAINKISESEVSEFVYDVFGKDGKEMSIHDLLIKLQYIVDISIQMKEDFETVSQFELGRKPNNNLTDIDIIELLNEIHFVKEKEQWLIENKSLAIEMLGDLYKDIYTNWEIVDKSRVNFKIINNYFGMDEIPGPLKKILIDSDFEKLVSLYSIIFNLTENNTLVFVKSLFSEDKTNQQILEFLKEMQHIIENSLSINNDCENIMRYSTSKNEPGKVTVKNIIQVLNSIKIVNQKRDWFHENNITLLENFGKHYMGENTDWDNVKKKLNILEHIIDYFDEKEIPNKLINFLMSSENSQDSFALFNFNKDIDYIGKNDFVSRLNYLLNIEDNQVADFNKVISILEAIENGVSISCSKYVNFSNCSKSTVQYETIMSDLILLKRTQEIEATVEGHLSELQSKFEFVYEGMNTNWDKVHSSLDYAIKFKNFCKEYSLSKGYINDVSSDKNISEWAIKYSKKLKEQYVDIKMDFCWFADLFDNGEALHGTSIYTIFDRIEKSINNLFLLEEWIDFRSIRQECRDIGLSEFVEKVELIGMPSHIIVDTFFKRFYRLWLDLMIPLYPAVYAFRSRSHQSTINEFNELDKSQFDIARLRILERLISRLPNTNIATSSVDEVGILKRELTKQRKIMPLRRLFNTIPNLLTALKPCLMMSPLSVSLFLQADGYNFDTVIFDEASQVCTEDAIGSIMRGKQVIIAGDSKQLPPTRFFATTFSDGDFDVDTDDESFDDTGAYDSILEEAVNAIPERTLKWHYRSRHEDLIAFSNAKIYNHELITFPSNMDKIANNGVEYVYVEDGTYDRGGKKDNLKEAKRVARLVFDHIKQHPNRSLGVVTFSEAQQHAVDNAITQLRRQNSQYEKFFTEDIEHAFFVKNLESVQGDERDTIIFSIGYAKDQNGVMYMNFGPLSRNGGHRRLNVAITRAKYNVKLVGSILPTDIKVENTNSEGVKMLRQYIEFAINGASVLQNELQFTNTVDVDSPFEEAVHDFLIKNGYNVITQVGCSGYRIDMAIKHPTLSGIFVLGIECDGATYHSARTARERDRLRQTVLEDIGWTIYRIWSTDWIKDTKTEGSKLLEAVKMAISNCEIGSKNNGSIGHTETAKEDTTSTNQAYVLTETKKAESEIENNNPYDFNYYEETDVYKITKISNDSQYLANVISYVVEKECPIHYELLCKRVATLFGNKKATVKVRTSVEHVLNMNLKDVVIKRDDFCWHKDLKEIKVKIPPLYGDGRAINYISTEELAEAMFVITGKSFGITKSYLYVVTARVFGFNRTGGNITQSMEKACLYLIESGRLKEVDGKIVV